MYYLLSMTTFDTWVQVINETRTEYVLTDDALVITLTGKTDVFAGSNDTDPRFTCSGNIMKAYTAGANKFTVFS